MKSLVEQYLEDQQQRGRSQDQALTHLSNFVAATFEALSQQVEPEALFGEFLNHWSRSWVKIWTEFVCAPPRSQLEAATLWQITELEVLAGFELAGMWRAQGFDRALTAAIRTEVADTRKRRQLTRAHKDAYPKQVSKFMDDGATWLRTECRSRVEDIIPLLPEQRTWTTDPYDRDPLICGLRGAAPTTTAMAWRFVADLKRCRAWHDISISDELKRAERDEVSRLHSWWVGLVWLASVLWRKNEVAIERQAKAEGKMSRHEATRDTRVHLLRLNTMLDAEAPAVHALRSKTA